MSKKNVIVAIVDELSDFVRPIPAAVQNLVPGPAHSLEHLPNRRERLWLMVCGPTQKRGRSSYWCRGYNCGVHKLCYPSLEHFWRPTQKGRKRKALAALQTETAQIRCAHF